MASLEQICARSACRMEVKSLRLQTPEGGTVVLMTERSPYADGGRVSIFPGEAFSVEFADMRSVNQPRFGKLLDRLDETRGVTFAKPGENPALSFQLRQDSDGPSMILTTKSTLDAMVKYDATMYVPSANGMREEHTSTCPVIAGGSALEMWPFPIRMVVLSNFRVIPKDAKNIACD